MPCLEKSGSLIGSPEESGWPTGTARGSTGGPYHGAAQDAQQELWDMEDLSP